MEFRILGPLEVTAGGQAVAVTGPRRRALLALLVVNANRPVATDRLLDQVWGGRPPGGGRVAVQTRVYQVRKALAAAAPGAPPFIVTADAGYLLRAAPDQIDAVRFEGLIDRGRAALREGRPSQAADLLREALALWRGPPLSEFAGQGWADVERARLDRLHTDGLETRVEADLALGRHEQVVPELEGRVGEQALSERWCALLMLALYRSGRQADALAAYQRARQVLAEELGVDPGPELRRLHQAVLTQDPALNVSAATRPHRGNPPTPASSFVGRRAELAELCELLPGTRLLTITGEGGAGKTRLALELATQVQEAHCEGVWLVDLAPLTDPARVPEAVAGALGLGEQEGRPLAHTLQQHLAGRELLLLLDNCEHLVEAVAGLAEDLLGAAPRVRLLATSRESLGIPGETVWRIPPLATPGPSTASADLSRLDAVRLFTERAAAGDPRFALTEATAEPVAEICRRLDGLPLAIELAAAVTRVLSVHEVAARLDDRFHILAGGRRGGPPRQQTLRATLDWSYQLLAADERRLLARLGVFAGSFDLEAVEGVCAGPDLPRVRILPVLARLADVCLVAVDRADAAAASRYRLLETVRLYARERLGQGQATRLRRAHLDYYLDVLEQAEPELRGPDQARWLRRLRREQPNLRAALDAALELGTPPRAARLAAALVPLWWALGQWTEGRTALSRVLDAAPDLPGSPRARLLRGAGFLAVFQCDYDQAAALCRQAVQVARSAGDQLEAIRATAVVGLALGFGGRGDAAAHLAAAAAEAETLGDLAARADALLYAGTLAVEQRHPDHAARSLRRALDLYQDAGNSRGVAYCQASLGAVAGLTGQPERGAALLEEAAAAFRSLDDRWGRSQALGMLATLAASQGDHHRATAMLGESIAGFTELGDRDSLAGCLVTLAGISAAGGQDRRAARLYGAAAGIRDAVGTHLSAAPEPDLVQLRARLGEDAFGRCFAEGRRMTPEQAATLALDAAVVT